LIEREQCLYEVSIIHLSRERASTLVSRARRKGFRVLVVQS
jgi:fructose-1,6-bisphosphatase/sedoheptulose 1,7-bisphosphatase-like protein